MNPDSETEKRGKTELKRRKDRHKISKRNSAPVPKTKFLGYLN